MEQIIRVSVAWAVALDLFKGCFARGKAGKRCVELKWCLIVVSALLSGFGMVEFMIKSRNHRCLVSFVGTSFWRSERCEKDALTFARLEKATNICYTMWIHLAGRYAWRGLDSRSLWKANPCFRSLTGNDCRSNCYEWKGMEKVVYLVKQMQERG